MDRSERSLARAERIARYAASVAISEDNPATKPIFDSLKTVFKTDARARRRANKANERAKYLAASFTLNGPDLFVDKYLRNFLTEYNGRLFNGNGDKQPNSFNVINSFIEPDEEALVLRLLPEKHYSLSLNLILDTLTDPKTEHSLKSLLKCTEELNIFEYHVLGGYSEISFDGHELTFHGVAFVRDGDELSIMAVFGKRVEELKNRVLDEKPIIYPGKEFLNEIESVDISDIEIVEGTNLVPMIVMSRLTMSDSRSQVRYVLTESKDTFDVVTNDPGLLRDMQRMGVDESYIKRALERINEYLPIFEFVEQLPLFHCEVGALDDHASVVRYPTGIKLEASSGTAKRIKKNVSPAECPNYVNVVTIDVAATAVDTFKIEPKNLKVESGGYWETLPASKSGTDRSGNVIYGKTWVQTQKSWYEIANVDAELKGPISVEIGSSDDVGTVYVMRNAQHPKDTYKIGFTSKEAEQRAAQLGGTSGQPDGFAIMQDWKVRSPRMIEKEVHNRLKAHRVNDRREFFRLDYRDLRKCIEDVIRESGAEI